MVHRRPEEEDETETEETEESFEDGKTQTYSLDLSELTVAEAKDEVKDGDYNVSNLLAQERENKDRKTLVEFLIAKA